MLGSFQGHLGHLQLATSCHGAWDPQPSRPRVTFEGPFWSKLFHGSNYPMDTFSIWVQSGVIKYGMTRDDVGRP